MSAADDAVLPPGQRAAELARFGLPQFAGRSVQPPARPVLTVSGAVRRPAQLELTELLAGLPRRDQVSDLHCVTTWSAPGLAWSGWAFADVLDRIAAAVLPAGQAGWLTVRGLDGFSSCLSLTDAAAPDVLLADRLAGSPLSGAHGAPLRLVSPTQYGYKSVKSVVAVEYRRRWSAGSARWLEHPRARVAAEERSALLPGPVWRHVWRLALPLARRPYRRG